MKTYLAVVALLLAIAASCSAQTASYPYYVSEAYYTNPPYTSERPQNNGTNSSRVSAENMPAGYQNGKSLAETNNFMLEKQINTDVIFKFDKNGTKSELNAHRYVLYSRSAVFEQMLLANPQANCAKATFVITDTDQAIFKEMLNFIYTDMPQITAKTVIPLGYAAKKYQLPKLAAACQTYLQYSIFPDNVCDLLDSAIYYNEEAIVNKSMALISNSTAQVIASNGFLQLSKPALLKIVSYECLGLQITEYALYNALIRWAKIQLQLKGNNFYPTETQCRQQLGDVYNYIRFPTMSMQQFAEISSRSDALSCEEKTCIYNFIGTRDQSNLTTSCLKFNFRNRSCEKLVERFPMVYNTYWGGSNQVDAIYIKTERDVTLTAIGTYPVLTTCGYSYSYYYSTGQIQLAVDVNPVYTSRNYYYPYGDTYSNGARIGGVSSYVANSTTPDSKNVAKVVLSEPVRLTAGIQYCITLRQLNGRGCYSHYGQTYFGSSPLASGCGSIWLANAQSSSTSTSSGQIPSFWFSC